MGARICPGCATRVDERRAKASPRCLRCGTPLGPPSPADGGRSSTFAPKQAGSGTSALPWILGGVALLVVVVLGGVVALIAVVGSRATPGAPVATVAAPPKVEAPPTAVSSAGSPPSAGTVKAPVPTVRTTATSRPPATTPVPFPTVTVAPTATATATGTATGTATATATGTNSGGTALAAFNRTKAQGEVDRVGAGLASCKRAAGPFGAGTIRVNFEPDGRVGTLSRPPFAGTAVGSCISARFLSIRIGPFLGSTQNIEKAFIIQQ